MYSVNLHVLRKAPLSHLSRKKEIPQPNTVKPITSVVIQFNGVLVRTSILTVINIKRPSLVGEKFDL